MAVEVDSIGVHTGDDLSNSCGSYRLLFNIKQMATSGMIISVHEAVESRHISATLELIP